MLIPFIIYVNKKPSYRHKGVDTGLSYPRQVIKLYAPTVYGLYIPIKLTLLTSLLYQKFSEKSILYSVIFELFTFTPGPIVEVSVTDLKYFPFAAAGFALIIADMIALKFS